VPLPPEESWFPAKRYGWGWGVPRRWQGVVVFLAFFAVLILAAIVAGRRTGWYVVTVLSASAALLAVCWWKGERPRWRWGGDS
jgi:hypothetical protein